MCEIENSINHHQHVKLTKTEQSIQIQKNKYAQYVARLFAGVVWNVYFKIGAVLFTLTRLDDQQTSDLESSYLQCCAVEEYTGKSDIFLKPKTL